ncbi:MAG TPA: TetR/AcrR family transcriptional regulator [Ktedonobacterales bacterium]|jgi:TetR/AcrR family transcriptional regulator|nr:TetR/AcrR family transcriptional regulator [Ktedonobacterales bacterium]
MDTSDDLNERQPLPGEGSASSLTPEPESPGSQEGQQRQREEQILDAALDEFASQGFAGATIKRIAQRAKLASQALIYWYFPTKEALFQAVLARSLPISQMVNDATSLLDQPPEQVLPQLARAYLAMADRPAALRLVRLFAPEALRRPEVAELLGGRVIGRILTFIERYLDHQVELGRLRPHDTRVSARAFVGMTLPQLGGKLFLHAIRIDGLSDDDYVETIVALFLRGIQPDA